MKKSPNTPQSSPQEDSQERWPEEDKEGYVRYTREELSYMIMLLDENEVDEEDIRGLCWAIYAARRGLSIVLEVPMEELTFQPLGSLYVPHPLPPHTPEDLRTLEEGLRIVFNQTTKDGERKLWLMKYLFGEKDKDGNLTFKKTAYYDITDEIKPMIDN